MRKKRLFTSLILMTACFSLASCKINKKPVKTTTSPTTVAPTTGTTPTTTPATDPNPITTTGDIITTRPLIPDYDVAEAYALNPNYSGQESGGEEEELESIAPQYNPDVEEEVYGLKYGTGEVSVEGEVQVLSVSGI